MLAEHRWRQRLVPDSHRSVRVPTRRRAGPGYEPVEPAAVGWSPRASVGAGAALVSLAPILMGVEGGSAAALAAALALAGGLLMLASGLKAQAEMRRFLQFEAVEVDPMTARILRRALRQAGVGDDEDVSSDRPGQRVGLGWLLAGGLLAAGAVGLLVTAMVYGAPFAGAYGESAAWFTAAPFVVAGSWVGLWMLLRGLAKRRDVRIRLTAERAVAEVGDAAGAAHDADAEADSVPLTVAAIVPLLAHREAPVRLAAANALGKVGDRLTVASLRGVNDRLPEVTYACRLAVERIEQRHGRVEPGMLSEPEGGGELSTPDDDVVTG